MPLQKDGKRSGISRRGFLKGVGAGTAAAGVATGRSMDGVDAQSESPVKGPGDIPITLTINGEETKVSVEPRVTLLDAMRNRLNITGAKRVCDRGTCGACTVVVDGQPAYACSMLAIDCVGREIRTVEGLGTPEKMAKIQQAFVNNDAQQCGFCTPGFIVACATFLEKHPNPTRDEVRTGLGGNLCRCGTYDGIIDAVLEAAKGGA